MDIMQNIRVCVKTYIGFNRKNNEDSFLIVDDGTGELDIRRHGRLYVLADGMGGQAGGEIASKMACTGMNEYYSQATNGQLEPDYFEARLQDLKSALYDVHNKIVEYGQINREYENMGTTLSAMVLTKDMALIAHVGDSRIYRLRDGNLEQLTEDHTFEQLFSKKGILTLQEASTHPMRHVMTQAVGQGIEEIYHRIEEIKRDDTFLMCSDGLHDMLSDSEIKDILFNKFTIREKCSRLVARALEMGGKDNVTIIVIQV